MHRDKTREFSTPKMMKAIASFAYRLTPSHSCRVEFKVIPRVAPGRSNGMCHVMELSRSTRTGVEPHR